MTNGQSLVFSSSPPMTRRHVNPNESQLNPSVNQINLNPNKVSRGLTRAGSLTGVQVPEKCLSIIDVFKPFAYWNQVGFPHHGLQLIKFIANLYLSSLPGGQETEKHTDQSPE